MGTFGLAAVGLVRPIIGCPYCDSEVGERVAAGIFNDGFWLNATLTLLPFSVLLLVVAVIRFGVPSQIARLGPASRRPGAGFRQPRDT